MGILNLCCLAVISKQGKGRKSGVEPRRQLAINPENLPATPATKLASKVMTCNPLDLVHMVEKVRAK